MFTNDSTTVQACRFFIFLIIWWKKKKKIAHKKKSSFELHFLGSLEGFH